MRQAAIMHEFVREVSTELGLRPPFTAQEYRRALSLAIGHPIEMTPRSISGRAFSGSCRAVQGAYIIQYRADGSLIQQERIKYHQLGHITLGHVSMTGDDDRAVLSLCRALMTDASGVRTRGAEGASAAVSSSQTRSVKEEKDQVVPHLRRPDHDGDAPPDDTGGAPGPLPGLPADRHRAHDHACHPVGGAHRWCRAGRAVARGRTR